MTPLVSIGLPVYNGENFIREAIESILAQTFGDFELIIADNASPDNTEYICRSYAAADPRVHYYRNKENLGGAYNHNKVFSLAQGKYFKWAAHDDKIAPQYLQQCVDVLEKYPSVVLAYPATMVINAQGKCIRKYQNELELTQPGPHQRFRQFHNIVHMNRNNHECHPVFGLIAGRTCPAWKVLRNTRASLHQKTPRQHFDAGLPYYHKPSRVVRPKEKRQASFVKVAMVLRVLAGNKPGRYHAEGKIVVLYGNGQMVLLEPQRSRKGPGKNGCLAVCPAVP